MLVNIRTTMIMTTITSMNTNIIINLLTKLLPPLKSGGFFLTGLIFEILNSNLLSRLTLPPKPS